MMNRKFIRPRRSGAFTLVELLVVIGIIAVLIAILLPTLGVARQQATSVKCLAQMRQFGNAFQMYVNENRGWMPSSDTCGPLYPSNFTDAYGNNIFPYVSSTQTWIGWVDGGATDASQTNGTLYKYLKNLPLYHCPADPNEYRKRSYSMNAFICTKDTWPVTQIFKVYKINQVPNTGGAIAFAEEPDPRSVNSGGSNTANLTQQWNLNGWYQIPQACDTMTGVQGADKDTWGDVVANWHRGGANFTFIDGHAENWRFTDVRTINFMKNDPTWPSPSYVTSNNVDLARVRKAIVTWSPKRSG